MPLSIWLKNDNQVLQVLKYSVTEVGAASSLLCVYEKNPEVIEEYILSFAQCDVKETLLHHDRSNIYKCSTPVPNKVL